MHRMKWFTTVLLPFALLLAGCSGGEGGSLGTSSAQTNAVAGVVTNNSGVRDDVERYITNTYSGPDQAQTKAALMQYARVLQALLVDASTPATTTKAIAGNHLQELVDAFQCLAARRPDDYLILRDELKQLVLDTEARQQVYSQAAILAEDSVPGIKYRNPSHWAQGCP